MDNTDVTRLNGKISGQTKEVRDESFPFRVVESIGLASSLNLPATTGEDWSPFFKVLNLDAKGREVHLRPVQEGC